MTFSYKVPMSKRMYKSLYKIPTYNYIMIFLIGFYLTLEIPFSVKLVNILANISSNNNDIETIEKFGRILTGIAVSLAIVGIYSFPKALKNNYRKIYTFFYIVFTIIFWTSITYVSLDQITSRIGNNSNNKTKENAYLAILAKTYIKNNSELFFDKNTKEENLKAFYAIMPSIGYNYLLKIANTDNNTLANTQAEDNFKNINKFKTEFFSSFDKKMNQYYQDYKDSIIIYNQNVSKIDNTIEEKWNKFNDYIKPYGKTLSAGDIMNMRKDLKKYENLEMPSNWNPRDKNMFSRVVYNKMINSINENYINAMKSKTNSNAIIPPNLKTFNDFLNNKNVQEIIKENYNLDKNNNIIINSNMNMNDFQKIIYEKLINNSAKEIKSIINTNNYSNIGEKAVKNATIPTLAIFLSIAGAGIHIFKIFGYILTISRNKIIILRNSKIKNIINILIIIMISILASKQNEITSSEIFLNSEAGLLKPALSYVINIQENFQILGNSIEKIGVWQIIKVIDNNFYNKFS